MKNHGELEHLYYGFREGGILLYVRLSFAGAKYISHCYSDLAFRDRTYNMTRYIHINFRHLLMLIMRKEADLYY